MANRFWSDDEHDLLCDLIADGVKFRDAGKRLGRTKNACIGRMHRFVKKIEEARFG